MMKAKTIAIELAANEVVEIQLIRKPVEVVPITAQQKKPEKRFYQLGWFVEYTGIPQNSAYQLTSKNLVPHIKRGRRLFFEKTLIDK